jgi:hypothetical protein
MHLLAERFFFSGVDRGFLKEVVKYYISMFVRTIFERRLVNTSLHIFRKKVLSDGHNSFFFCLHIYSL